MRVTEKLRVKIQTGCRANPVFATWRSHKGGQEHWLFHKVQTESLSTERISEIEPYDRDLENARGQIFDTEIFAQPKLTVYALVSEEDVRGLMTITHSIAVEVLTNPLTWEAEGCKWQTYRVEAGSFRVIDTDEAEAEIQLTFIQPYINNPAR